MSDRKTNYLALTSKTETLKSKTPAQILELLKEENSGIEVPNFSNFLFSDKHTVPKGAQVIKDKFYMGKVYDLHFVKKDGIGNHVLYFVRK